jgi:hypothetical protein
MPLSRRTFTRAALLGAGSVALGQGLLATAITLPGTARAAARDAIDTRLGPLGPADAEGLRLPPGFVGRRVARTGEPPVPGATAWHAAPDGAACVPRPDGGWSYVSNCELPAPDGGVYALDFDARGEPVGMRTLLTGAARPCAGGLSGTGHWLACEEVPEGIVWEVDVTGAQPPVRRPALGVFNHEAAARDPHTGCIYLTEDDRAGGLYRFTPARTNDLAEGQLDVLAERDGTLLWLPVPDPLAREVPTRQQVPGMLAFRGGEGAWFSQGELSFTTKGDDRLWLYVPARNALSVLYDGEADETAPLRGVDNLIQDAAGLRYVAEDGGDMQVCIVDAAGRASVLAQLTGVRGSEITGLAFAPAGDRLYFSSQRRPGATYEIRGPFASLQSR